MDLAVFIGELLGIHGEVCVPGLGCFVKTRINSRYNEKEGKLYPPSSQVLFDPQTIDDDTLIEYISEKKHISVSSAKYFVDKYIANLKEQIALYEVAFTDIGWLYTENGKLSFKAKETLSPVDPDFFGLPPVRLYKLGQQPAFEPEEIQPVTPPPVIAYEPATSTLAESAVTEELQQEALEEEYEERRSLSIWIILAIVLAVIGLAAFALYTFRPELFDRFNQHKKQPVSILPIVKKPKVDTVKKATDTTSAGVSAFTPDSADRLNPAQLARIPHWELISDEAATTKEINQLLGEYQKVGIKAKVIEEPGTLTAISLGTYFSKAEAVAAKDELIKTHRINKEVRIQPFLPIKPNP